MRMHSKKLLACLTAAMLAGGCGYSQTVKDGWKETRSLWYTYANVPAQVDYSATGELEKADMDLAVRMLEIDTRLAELERIMSNADKPPTQEWLSGFFRQFPWLGGFAGIRADGQLIGQEPAMPLKPTDFSPLLEAPTEKDRRALRSYVQNTPMGPEVYLGIPLYNADQFIGVIACHFDMRALLKFCAEPEELLIFTPHTVLWPGRYDFAATPASSVDWERTVRHESRGVCANESGSLLWVTRYLANQPLIFAVPVKGSFAPGNGEVGAFAGQEPAAVRASAPETHRSPEIVPDLEAERGVPDVGAPEEESAPAEDVRQGMQLPSPFGPY
ncbi:MAG: hypothetical protein PUB01_00625 [Desulfovibrionaceae bacterium]|nr:hypothetical protein [Desulfovibrionaceae bacterium]